MSEIKWLPEALLDIERLYAFLMDKHPEVAVRAATAILEGAKLLETSVHIGRRMPDNTGRREWFIPFGTGAYVVRYRIELPETAVIIRVWHSREDRL